MRSLQILAVLLVVFVLGACSGAKREQQPVPGGPDPYGGWAGLFWIDERPIDGELIEGGTMLVWYDSNWFRMYFARAGLDVEGTTSGWDLIDSAGLRITGTYHAAGETNDAGLISDEPWIDYRVELDSGAVIFGRVDPD